MDEQNNTPNPFNEENSGQQNTAENPTANRDPYNMPYSDPYNIPPQQNNGQFNPYAQQPQQGQQYDPRPQQQNMGQYNPYAQQQSQPYNMPQQDPRQNTNPYAQQYRQQNYAYPPQQGYYQQGYGMPYMQQKPSTGMAVASMVLGIVSLVLGIFMFAFPPLLLTPVIGLILGIVYKTKRLPVGKGISTAGIITSSLGIVLPVILLIIIGMFLLSDAGTEFMRSYLEKLKNISPEDYEQFYKMYGEQFPDWFKGAVMLFFGK